MTETATAKAAFAPAWPYLYKAPAGNRITAPYGQSSAFNRDLTVDELKPLTDSFPVPGRKLRLIGGYTFLGSYLAGVALWFATTVMEDSHALPNDFAKQLHAGVEVFGALVLIGAALGIAGIVTDLIAWKKWGKVLEGAWGRYEGRIVRTRSLPKGRREQVNLLGQRLDGVLEQLDGNDPMACQLDADARSAIGQYIDRPALSKDARRVARSAVADARVQQVRDEYEAAVAAENVTLQIAEKAVEAIQDYAAEVNAAVAEQEIIELAVALSAGR
ncbi:hypothetical protein GCM10023063_15630 [Arthrobacter methylotrophus]|uniref:5-bromo-4-chloroindolyl phosphate hydrolysis protein n=1 Tax=Arthrobacter methylotrophus TaxID=121291 RepID=A0ABV5UN83_9MICC